MSVLSDFISRQFSRPSGLIGRFVFSKILNHTNKESNAAVLKALDIGPSDDYLEIGFGGGDLFLKVAELISKGSITGVEISEEMIEHVQTKLARQSSTNVKLLTGDLTQLPLEAESISKIATVNTIYFTKDLSKACGEIFRVLNGAGRVVIGFGDSECLASQNLPKTTFTYRDDVEVINELKNSGLEVTNQLKLPRSAGGAFHVVTAEKKVL